ncbi:MAG: Dabb family protein [Bacteroidota bacterium]
MIRHIVMFKFKEFPSEAGQIAAERAVKERLDELPVKIDLIRRYEAGIDTRKLPWSYDIVLVMDFDSMADLDAYTLHPAHQEFISFNKGYSIAKACIDYEI